MQTSEKSTARASVRRWGNSLALRITSSVAKTAGLHEGDAVEITAGANGLVIRRARKPARHEQLLQGILATSEDELFADLTPETSGHDLLARKLPSEIVR